MERIILLEERERESKRGEETEHEPHMHIE